MEIIINDPSQLWRVLGWAIMLLFVVIACMNTKSYRREEQRRTLREIRDLLREQKAGKE